jgi:DNA polymerase III delta prime subunit
MSRAIVQALRADNTYERIKNIYTTAALGFNSEAVHSEIESLQASRVSRGLISRSITAKVLNKAIVTDMANRSRLVEIRSKCNRSLQLVHMALESARIHIRATYGDLLRSAYGSTKADMDAGINKMLINYVQLRSDLEHSIENIDIVVKDIDQASYGLRNLVDIMKLTLGGRTSEEII